MRKILKNILSHGIAVVVGFAIAIAVTVYAATQIPSAQVKYNDTTVDEALNDLYSKADNQYFDFATANANTTGKVFASKKGVCIARNKTVYCFKVNNWAEEQTHIQQVFSDISCDVYSSYVYCIASDFYCGVNLDGNVYCYDQPDYSLCNVNADGSVYCN